MCPLKLSPTTSMALVETEMRRKVQKKWVKLIFSREVRSRLSQEVM